MVKQTTNAESANPYLAELKKLKPQLQKEANNILDTVAQRAEYYRGVIGDEKFDLLFGNHSADENQVFQYAHDLPNDDGTRGFNEIFSKVSEGMTRPNGYNRFVDIHADGSIMVALNDNCPRGLGDNTGYTLNCSAVIDSQGLRIRTSVPATFYETDTLSATPNPLVIADNEFYSAVRENQPYCYREPVSQVEHHHPQVAVNGQTSSTVIDFAGFAPANHPDRIVRIVRVDDNKLIFDDTPITK